MQKQYPADIILRSSDKKLFHSWKMFLSFSSPVFSGMFTLPGPGPDTSDNVNERHDGLPVVDLEEGSCTLGHILALCHPPCCTEQQFKITNLRELRALLKATMKYEMENVYHVALEQLSNPSIFREDPLGVYALACQYECREAARLAARYTLALPSVVHAYTPDLEKIHAGHLCHLLLYREECVSAACSLTVNHMWIKHANFSPLFECKHMPPQKDGQPGEEYKPVHSWWLEYMAKSESALRGSPHGDAVKDPKLVDAALAAILASKCKHCNISRVQKSFRTFVHTFAENIECWVATVEIDLGF